MADTPGGEPVAVPAEGALVPRDVSPEAIEAAGSVTEVADDGYSWHAAGRVAVGARAGIGPAGHRGSALAFDADVIPT